MNFELEAQYIPTQLDRRKVDIGLPLAYDRRTSGFSLDHYAAVSLLKNGVSLDDTFDHWQGSPGDEGAADMVPLAWQTHAAGYLRTGLAKEAAIHDGVLDPVIDKSRHLREGITYYLATNPANTAEHSTARLIDVASVDQLPTLALTGAGMTDQGISRLEGALDSGYQLKELGALANSTNGFSKGATEIIRKVLVDTVSDDNGNKNVLFCSMVDKACVGLAHAISAANLEPVGSPTVLEENEYREETTLIPIIIDPDNFVRNIFNAYLSAKRVSEKRRYLENTLFFAEAVPSRFIPDEVASIRAAIGRSLIRSVPERGLN